VFKEGSNKYWSAVLVRNHPLAITKVEYKSASNATYKALARQDYNYWLDTSGFGNGPYSLRVTDTRGSVVEIGNLEGLPEQAIGSPRVIETTAQFPRCP
jgi:expansin (peptidoglycan-binding protein)